MKAVVRKIAVPVAVGVLVTGSPLALAVPFYERAWFKPFAKFCDWPMMFAKEHFRWLFRGNESSRALEFLLINVVSWSLFFGMTFLIARAALRRTTRARGKSGN
jgi:hypothetical protein